MELLIPRIVIAGTQSGVGKTSVTLGVVAALRRRGVCVQTFKVGPDYLDPTYLSLASGRPCYNLDCWMTDQVYVEGLFQRVCKDADVAIIEGVMGLFDGADPSTLDGSTAEVAGWLDAPVVLVANAHGAGRSFAAMVHGFATFDPKVRVAGVIANRSGSERHTQWLAESLTSASLPPLLGSVQRGALPELPSRHLGLVTADPVRFSQQLLDQLADAVEKAVSLDAVLEAGRSNEARAGILPVTNPCGQNARARLRLGVARDEAFHFYYPDNLDALELAGCELVPFSPLRDQSLPSALHGLYIGGGYPEEYAGDLSANVGMLESIRKFAAADGLIYAECGGLMYLSEGIEMLDGARHPLSGILPAWTRMHPQRKSLGYVGITLTRDCFWGNAGESLRGHEFHYSTMIQSPAGWDTAYGVEYRRSEASVPEGFQRGSVLASYAHIHFASQPRAIKNFICCLKRHTP